MSTLTYLDLIAAYLPSDVAATSNAELLRELGDLPGAFTCNQFDLVSPWPYERGPLGPLLLPEGVGAHGAYARPTSDEQNIELVVANNGWPIEVSICPGPLPPPLECNSPNNYWLGQLGAWAIRDDHIVLRQPDVLALFEVMSGRKPLALLDSDDRRRVDRLAAIANIAGLHVDIRHWFDPCGQRDVWFINIARPETFDELIDLDSVCTYYEHALAGSRHTDETDELIGAVDDLWGTSPAELLDEVDDLVVAPFNDGSDLGPPSTVTGVALGYWPPTTAVLHLVHLHPEQAVGLGRAPLTEWENLRYSADLWGTFDNDGAIAVRAACA